MPSYIVTRTQDENSKINTLRSGRAAYVIASNQLWLHAYHFIDNGSSIQFVTLMPALSASINVYLQLVL